MKLGALFYGVHYGKYDKLVHAFVAFFLTIILLLVSMKLWIAIGIVVALSIAKEIYDMTKPHDHFDFADIAADLFGVALALIVWRSYIMGILYV